MRYDFPEDELTEIGGCPILLGTLSVMIVLSTAVPFTESVVVCPISLMPAEKASWLVQVADPLGTNTVSPSTAEATAELTAA